MNQGRTRRLAAVWFADIVGYTALSTRLAGVIEGEAAEGDLLRPVE